MTVEGRPPAGGGFWQSSGYALLERRADGRLGVTDAFLRAYMGRPELRPIEDSGPEEIALHAALLAEPKAAVEAAQLAALADPEARDNYRVFLQFRDHLLAHDTLEAGYLGLFRRRVDGIAPLFVDQMAHAILRGVLADCGDPFRLRTAELLFRVQTVAVDGGAIMLADEEIVDMRAVQKSRGRELLQPEGNAPLQIEMDVLTPANAGDYWERSDRFDMAVNVGFTEPGLDALCRVLEGWIAHFLAVPVTIQPVQQISDQRWVWHVGLDAEASGLLNALYRGETVPEAVMTRLLSLFRLDFRDPGDMRADIAGRPVYLAMAMDERQRLRLKPQNLLVDLPLANPA